MPDEKLIAYYRARATEYEQIYFRDNPPRRKELTDEAARLAELSRGQRVLDLACGTGYWTEIMARTAGEIIAVDISPEMLAEARKKSYAGPVLFIRADLNHLPLKSHGFDLVTLGFWFSHQPKQEYDRLFDIIREQLASAASGRVWLIDNNPPAEGPNRDSAGKDEFGNNYKRRLLDSGEEHIILKNYFTPSQLEAIFKPHFTIERLTYGEYYWVVVLRQCS
ncbi:MAG: class I SAM-dependent methyltransferase [Candidatus Zixiibacteriota bacterium]|nr:MAG: class I SAM-dependent methyltransferase [candidate division Zixibacteria bacterium]